MKYLKETAPSQAPDESPIYRSNVCNDQLLSEIPNVTTCYELLTESVSLHNTKKAFGHREIVDVIEETKEIEKKVDGAIKTEVKKWSFYQLADYDWWSFDELLEYCKQAGSGFRNLGLKERDFIGIFAPTNRYWKTIAFGAYSQNMTVVTVYDTLGTDGLTHALNEGEIVTLFTSGQLLGNILKVLPQVPKLKNIIYHGLADDKAVNELNTKTDIKVLKFDELIKLGADNPHEVVPPKPEDLSCIMYTSGTTGAPKGVQLTHANLVGVIGGVQHLTSSYIYKHDVFISMLPLAHILALSVDFYLTYIGMKIGYSSPRTLTDTSVRNCVGDLKALQPTLLIAVPQVFETIRKGIFNKVNSSGAVTKFLFNSVLNLKSFLRGHNLPNSMFDFVFGSIKQLTGGKLRLAVCGGAPLSASLQDFITDSLCTMIQGFGLTEVCGLSVVGTPDVSKTGEIGKLSPAFEIKLKDIPDAGYTHKNINPQGELWYRGQPVSTGYFKNEKETKEAFTEDGWFKTGDVAEITPRGTLKIIDRKKNLVKLSNGEYIALEKIESFYRNNQLINTICVCADSERPKPIAVVVANLEALKNTCREKGITEPQDLEEASQSEEITKLVYKACLDEAKISGLKGTEIIAGLYLAPEEWTVDNDFLTAAQKMKRRNIQTSYKEQIDKLFNQIPN